MGRSPFSSKEVMNKGTWTAHEDQLLLDYIKVHGEGKWGNVPKETGLKRCGKSCRLRWLNYLRPDIKRGNITQDEEDLIIRLHKLLGNRWSLIAGRLPGRTDNEVKNYWNTILAKRQHGKKAITREASDAHNSDDVAPKKPKVEYYNVAMSPTKDGDQLVNSMAAADSESTDGLSSSSSREENSMDLLIDFDVGDMSLPEFLNLDFAKLSNNGRFNMINVTEGADASDNGCKSTDDQTPVFSGQAFFSPEDMVENWSVSDCIQGIADSDFGSLASFIQSAEEWII